MTKQEISDELMKLIDLFYNDIKLYKDWLNCMKGFFGNDFPMIQKFESMVDKFKYNGEIHIKHIAQFYNNISKQI
jgi:hypothetical protein